jgi:hypothetical protein
MMAKKKPKEKKTKRPRKKTLVQPEAKTRRYQRKTIKVSSARSLGSLYQELQEDKKIGVGKDSPEAERIPVAIRIERVQYGLYPEYTIFLKCQCMERNQEYRFILERMENNEGILVKERCFEWKKGGGTKERVLWKTYYPDVVEMGKKEREKKIKSRESAARDMLFDFVMGAAKAIIDYHSDERTLPLVWHDYLDETTRRRFYEDAKTCFWSMQMHLRKKGA